MKILKNRLFIFILGGIFFSSIAVFAVTTISADKITYTDKNNVERTVDVVLDDLYDKANSERVATQVATLTTQGATYTMQNDGYIVGTAQSTGVYSAGTGSAAIIFLNDKRLVLTTYSDSSIYDVSVYASKGTVVTTRSDAGTYSLTVYEWK